MSYDSDLDESNLTRTPVTGCDPVEFTFDENTISDLHKEAFGVRPRGDYFAWWNSCSDTEKQAEWDHLIDIAERAVVEEKAMQAEAAVRFEKLVAKTIKLGAGDRATALRWIMDASICGGDWEFLCFEHGLAYGYFKEQV